MPFSTLFLTSFIGQRQSFGFSPVAVRLSLQPQRMPSQLRFLSPSSTKVDRNWASSPPNNRSEIALHGIFFLKVYERAGDYPSTAARLTRIYICSTIAPLLRSVKHEQWDILKWRHGTLRKVFQHGLLTRCAIDSKGGGFPPENGNSKRLMRAKRVWANLMALWLSALFRAEHHSANRASFLRAQVTEYIHLLQHSRLMSSTN